MGREGEADRVGEGRTGEAHRSVEAISTESEGEWVSQASDAPRTLD